MARLIASGYGKNVDGLGNPQPSPNPYSARVVAMRVDAVHRLNVGGR